MWLEPNDTLSMSEGESGTVFVSFKEFDHDLWILPAIDEKTFLRIDSANPHVASAVEDELVISANDFNVTIEVLAKLIGKTTLTFKMYDKFELTREITEPPEVVRTLEVSVIRSYPEAQLIFTIFVAILVGINNISMGCVISIPTIISVLKKPIAPLIGFACQFLIMPLGSYFIGAYMFPDDVLFRLGLFVLGCCPGGTGSNFWTLLFDGDVDLSITMTFVSTLAAMAMMPLWIFTLGRRLLREANIVVPYFNLITSLVILTITLGIGLLIQRYKPKVAHFLKKIMKPMTAIIMTIVILGGTYISWYIFLHMTWKIALAGLGCALSGYVLGAVVAAVCGLNRQQVIAVSIETALQNPGVAFVLLQLSLPQPDSEIAAIPVVAQLFMTGIPIWTVYVFYFAIKFVKRKVKERKNRRPDGDEKDTKGKEAELEELKSSA